MPAEKEAVSEKRGTTPFSSPLREGERMMVVCNACRYCEGYCAVFPAMERRLTFADGDLRYLANLCHNCGECLYACQYAPPHEFRIDLPRTLAEIRLESYGAYAWPGALSASYQRQSVLTSLALAASLIVFMMIFTLLFGSLEQPAREADFYRVIPHHMMVGLFGGVFGFMSIALGVGWFRFWRDARENVSALANPSALMQAVRDVLTLKYLHGSGADCTYSGVEARTPWRRRFHHLTYYGFLFSFASTSVAAIYHMGFGWLAPYGYTSLPVVLGTAGGIGLVIGPLGLYALRRRRDPDTADPAQQGLDEGFIVLLLLSSLTGLLLLVLRETSAMAMLLIVHLGVVLALFLTLPYGKFVHGVYRSAALLKNALEDRRSALQVGSSK
jgi:citrate/tricarballylate utilization protein